MKQHTKSSNEVTPMLADLSAVQTSINEVDYTTTPFNMTITSEEKAQNVMSVEEIFSAMNAKTREMEELRDSIRVLELDLAASKSELERLMKLVKPVGRLTKKFNPNSEKFPTISPTEKRALKVKIRVMKNQILLKKDNLDKKRTSYNLYHKATLEQMKLDELRNKAQSGHWVKRNKWSVTARLVKFLNMLLVEHRESLLELAELAKVTDSYKGGDFAKKLESLLDAHDVETAILCSHELRSELYTSIGVTLKEWDTTISSQFTQLVIK